MAHKNKKHEGQPCHAESVGIVLLAGVVFFCAHLLVVYIVDNMVGMRDKMLHETREEEQRRGACNTLTNITTSVVTLAMLAAFLWGSKLCMKQADVVRLRESV